MGCTEPIVNDKVKYGNSEASVASVICCGINVASLLMRERGSKVDPSVKQTKECTLIEPILCAEEVGVKERGKYLECSCCWTLFVQLGRMSQV